jgi:hypothetical protein
MALKKKPAVKSRTWNKGLEAGQSQAPESLRAPRQGPSGGVRAPWGLPMARWQRHGRRAMSVTSWTGKSRVSPKIGNLRARARARVMGS